MKIAQFKNVAADLVTIAGEDHGKFLVEHMGYVRISATVDVEFPPVSSTADELAALDKVRVELVQKFGRALKEIDERRQSLRALTLDVFA